MLCSRIREVASKVENQTMPIGRADLLRILCGECDNTDTCPSLAMQFDHAPAEAPERRTNRLAR